MRRRTLVAVLLAGACTVPGRVDAQTTFGSSTNVTLNAASDSSTQDSPSWLFPVAKLDESLPGWLQFGGEYRNRYEGPSGIGFAQTRDFYLLDRLRVWWPFGPRTGCSLRAEFRILAFFSINTFLPPIPIRTPGRSGKVTVRLAVRQKVGWT